MQHISLKFVIKIAQFLTLLGFSATSVVAQSFEVDAVAEFATPVEIIAGESFSFGIVAVPSDSDCGYTINPDGFKQTTGNSKCQFLSGLTRPARFEVSCGPDTLVRFEAIYTDTSPLGTTFEPGPAPLSIDGLTPSDVVQILPCDNDGLSEVFAGAKLTVTPMSKTGYTSQVGSIRLEAAYD